MARIKDLVRLLFCSCVCRVSWCCFYFLFMSSNGSIVESGASLLTTFYFTAFFHFRGENPRLCPKRPTTPSTSSGPPTPSTWPKTRAWRPSPRAPADRPPNTPISTKWTTRTQRPRSPTTASAKWTRYHASFSQFCSSSSTWATGPHTSTESRRSWRPTT